MEMIDFGIVEVYVDAATITKSTGGSSFKENATESKRIETEAEVVDTTDAPQELEDGDEHHVERNVDDEGVQNTNVVLVEENFSSIEDLDYNLVKESDIDDGLDDNELSDDDEYIKARKNRGKYRKYVPIDEVVDRIDTNKGFKKIS